MVFPNFKLENNFSFRVLAKIKYALNDFRGALSDLNKADKLDPNNHILLRYSAFVFIICALLLVLCLSF